MFVDQACLYREQHCVSVIAEKVFLHLQSIEVCDFAPKNMTLTGSVQCSKNVTLTGSVQCSVQCVYQ
jgi:hypothetical protein